MVHHAKTNNSTDESFLANRIVLKELLVLANSKLKNGGRLIFWLPTVPNQSISEIQNEIERLISSLESSRLKFVDAAKEETNLQLWRWLVVLESDR